jgi:hypothetical protein
VIANVLHHREEQKMKRFITTAAAVVLVTCIAHVMAQDQEQNATKYYAVQGELMNCGPPEFVLISEVDPAAQTITVFQTKELGDPASRIVGFHRVFKVDEIEVTNARRKKLDKKEVADLKGRLAIVGNQQISGAYLGMLLEDTVVVTYSPISK